MRVGFFTTDGWFEPHRAAVRAVEETVISLEKGSNMSVVERQELLN